jgi:hypothetical protein
MALNRFGGSGSGAEPVWTVELKVFIPKICKNKYLTSALLNNSGGMSTRDR